MDLTDVTALANRLMTEHGIAGKGWTFRFDNAKRHMGCCNYSTKTITVSRYFAAEANEAEVRDTILHEVAHVLAGHAAAHQIAWKVIAVRIGATPSACGSNPYYDRLRVEATAHAKSTARSLPAHSPVLVTTRARVGDRVVIRGRYTRPVPGTVMVVTEVRRTRYILHDERTGRDYSIPFEGARLHIEGEPLDRTTLMPGGAAPALDPVAKVAPSATATTLRAGEVGVILRGVHQGVQFTIEKRNPKTYVGTLRGRSYRIPHTMVGRAA